jgi:hypothetical protein
MGVGEAGVSGCSRGTGMGGRAGVSSTGWRQCVGGWSGVDTASTAQALCISAVSSLGTPVRCCHVWRCAFFFFAIIVVVVGSSDA